MTNSLENLSPKKRQLYEMLLEERQQNKGAGIQPTIQRRKETITELPLSFAQQRLWFLNQLEPDNAAYNLSFARRLKGELNEEVLQQSFDEIIRRHEILRTTFAAPDGRAAQLLGPPQSLPITRHDFSTVSADRQDDELRRRLNQQAQLPFSLDRWPLLRVNVIRLAPNEHVLQLVMHHIISDGWSMQVLIQELSSLYAAYSKSEQSPLAELPMQYSDYALWQREWLTGEVLEAQLQYWRRQLGDAAAAVLELPTDRPRPAAMSHRGRREAIVLGAELTQGLRALSRRYGVTLFMTLLAGFQALLWRYSGAETVVTGVPIAGRSRVELEGLVGFFANTLALRVAVRGEQTFEELLQVVQRVCLGAYEHQEIPFEKVVEELHPQRQLNRNPLFQVMFIFQTVAQEKLILPGLEISGLDLENETSIFDLSLTAVEEENNLRMLLQYSTDLFEAETIKRTLNYLERLLEGVVANPQQRVLELPLLAEVERQQILVEWNRTEKKFESENRCIHELFERQVEKTPDTSALIFEGQQLSYRELNCRANSLAHYLRRLGVGPEVLVGLYLERSVEMVVALLAVLKAGGGYVPLDPEYPRERVSFMLADAAAPVLLTQARLLHSVDGTAARVVAIDREWSVISEESTDNPQSAAGSENLAYVIYTSGSTGLPKGAMNTHGAISNRLLWMQDAYDLQADDTVLQKTPFSFDVSVWEFFWPLITGACLVVARPGGHRDSRYLVELIKGCEVTTLHFVPSMLAAFLEEPATEQCTSLRRVICSGEVLTAELQERFYGRFDTTALHNLYGPTEAAIDVTSWNCERDGGRQREPIGRPIANTTVYILDEQMYPAPVGVTGELYIGGAAVGRGYWRQAGLTAERFVPHPHGRELGARLYRTGDVCRWLSDGNIEYVGRSDGQVKVRGHRIELGEVESALRRIAGVSECVVIAHADGDSGQRLVAYVVASEPVEPETRLQWRRKLSEQLPEYMIPALFMVLTELPLTVNGKVDRRALPVPEVSRSELSREYAVARTVSEELLVAIWSEVLRVERIGIHDNFFELGGDSILSIQVIARANKRGLRLTPRQLFEHQTIAELAAVVGTTAAITAEQGRVSGAVPLTPIQHWFFSQQFQAPHHFNQSLLLSLRQPVSVSVLEQAVTALVDHHDALRLRYRRTEQGWEQFNAAAESNPIFTQVDLSDLPADEQSLAIEAHAGEMQASLDLEHGPLLKVVYFDLGAERGRRLLIVIHHLAVDGVSWRILLEDLVLGCEQAGVGKPIGFPPKTTSFKQWAEQLQKYAASAEVANQTSYWLDIAARSQPVRPLPVELQGKNNKVNAARSLSISLSAEETQALLQEVPDVYQTQIQEVLLAALLETLSEWSGERRVLIEVEGHGREEIGSELDVTRTVGWFTTRYPVLLEKEEGSKTEELLKQVKEQVRGVPKRGTGYGLLKYMSDEAEVREALRRGSEAEVSFNYLGQFDQVLNQDSLFELAGESVGPVVSLQENRQHLFELNGSVVGGQLRLGWGYSEELHRRETIEQLADAFKGNLQKLIAHCRLPELDRSNEKIEDIYPLSPVQQGLLFHNRYNPESSVYFNRLSYTLQGELNVEAFEKTWQHVVERNPVLRSSFRWERLPSPVQIVHRQVKVPLEYHDWRNLSEAEQQEQLEQFLKSDRHSGLNLSAPPLMRLALLQLSDDRYQFVWSHHHILLDGWSLFLLLNEAFVLYDSVCRGEDLQLPKSRPYRDYINWLQQQDMQKAETFWRQTLKGFRAPTPLVMEATDGQQRVDDYEDQATHLSTESTTSLRAIARRYQLTLNTIVQGAWALLLSHYSGEQDVVFGAVVSGRPGELSGAEKMVGLFINTLPVRVKVSPEETAVNWLRRLQVQQAETRQYEFSPLAEVQRWSEVEGGLGLFESILVFENYPIDAPLRNRGGSLEIGQGRLIEQTNYPLCVVATPGSEFSLQLKHDPQRFSGATIKRMLGHLQNILAAFAADLEQPLSQITLTEEEQKLLDQWNDTSTEYPDSRIIHTLIETQVRKTPHAVAVEFEQLSLSYDDLNARANRLARHLRQLGISTESLVGVYMERSLEMVVALLGVLKAGGAYVPIDPLYPEERVSYMLSDSGAEVVVTQGHLAERLATSKAQLVRLDIEEKEIEQQIDQNVNLDVREDNLAYAIYTSGSTGQPKGVMISHRSITNRLLWMRDRHPLSADDAVLQKTAVSFDPSISELFAPLISGARLVMARSGGQQDPSYLVEAIKRHRITRLQLVPTMLSTLVEHKGFSSCDTLKEVFCGGEALPAQLIEKFYDRMGRLGVQLYNLYGPTEAAIDVTSFDCTVHSSTTIVPIGFPIANTRIHLLDHYLRPVPIRALGELYISGVQLARGYLGRADLTAERFLPDPYAKELGARMYRTGDLCRYLEDGAIEYIARADNQVKIRGFRIELGEIDAVLEQCPDVRQVVTLLREDQPGNKRLVAYLVPLNNASPKIDEVRRFARKKLPGHMVPAAFAVVESLPLTPNGKIDYRALPDPNELGPQSDADFVSPRNELEHKIAAIWKEVLGLRQVSVHDNFFDLGGHSILMAQVFEQLRQTVRQNITMVEFFEHPTISALAKYLSREKGAAASATAGNLPAQAEKQREGKDRLRQQFRQRQRGRRG